MSFVAGGTSAPQPRNSGDLNFGQVFAVTAHVDRRAPDDGDLMTAARAGEAWALGEVWRRYSPAVIGYLRSRGANDPEDLASEVFVQVFGRIKKFRGDEAALRSFVFSVA